MLVIALIPAVLLIIQIAVVSIWIYSRLKKSIPLGFKIERKIRFELQTKDLHG